MKHFSRDSSKKVKAPMFRMKHTGIKSVIFFHVREANADDKNKNSDANC